MTTEKNGWVKDYISERMVKETPEEIEAVQVFSRLLVEDYNYPKEHIQTRPQYRVKARPSDTVKEYPVDIAVFTDRRHDDDTVLNPQNWTAPKATFWSILLTERGSDGPAQAVLARVQSQGRP